MSVGIIRTAVALLALVAAFSGPRTTAAQGTAGAFTVQPGGTATITFESFCLDYGKKFPDSIGLPPTSTAEPGVTGAVNYAWSKGYTTSQPKEVQFALWQARGATDAPAPGAIGQEITANAGTQPAAPSGATSLIDAINNNQVRVTESAWQGIGEQLTINNFQDNFQGRGELRIENTSNQALTLYMPVGTVFPAPSAEFQSMAGYATDVQVENVNAQQQSMPETGASDLTLGQMAALVLLGLNVVALGFVLRKRALA